MSKRDYMEFMDYLVGNLDTEGVSSLEKVGQLGKKDLYQKAEILKNMYAVSTVGSEVGATSGTGKLKTGSTFSEVLDKEARDAWLLYKDGERNLEKVNPLSQYGVEDLDSELDDEFGISRAKEEKDREKEENRKLAELADSLGLSCGVGGTEGVNGSAPEGYFTDAVKGLNTSDAEGSVEIVSSDSDGGSGTPWDDGSVVDAQGVQSLFNSAVGGATGAGSADEEDEDWYSDATGDEENDGWSSEEDNEGAESSDASALMGMFTSAMGGGGSESGGSDGEEISYDYGYSGGEDSESGEDDSDESEDFSYGYGYSTDADSYDSGSDDSGNSDDDQVFDYGYSTGEDSSKESGSDSDGSGSDDDDQVFDYGYSTGDEEKSKGPGSDSTSDSEDDDEPITYGYTSETPSKPSEDFSATGDSAFVGNPRGGKNPHSRMRRGMNGGVPGAQGGYYGGESGAFSTGGREIPLGDAGAFSRSDEESVLSVARKLYSISNKFKRKG